MLAHLRNLLAYAEWADAVFLRVWGRSPARDHEDMRLRATHVVQVQEAFITALTGGALVMPAEAPPEAYDVLRARFAASHRNLRDFAARQTAESLPTTVRIPWFPDPPCIITVADALAQVVLHTQHHRGQLMTRLRDLGGKPKDVDWIIWLWRQKPHGCWD